MSKRVSAVEEVRSHVKVLQEMLSRYRRPGQAPPDQEALQVCFFFFFFGLFAISRAAPVEVPRLGVPSEL